MAYKWTTERYIAEVENSSDSGLREYQELELDFVKATESISEATLIDVGAGYGRVLPKLAGMAEAYIAVEQDEDMLEELKKRVDSQPNARLIIGSGNELASLIPAETSRPLLLSLQNTLGPWDGSRDIAIQQLAEVAKRGSGAVIISLFCQEALQNWGIAMYATASGLVGNYNAQASDIPRGMFRSDTGYESHWFTSDEREAIKQSMGGTLLREQVTPNFHIFQIGY